MPTADKLIYIRVHCVEPSCESCKLEPGSTCPRKNWKDWTPEEIETAYAILTNNAKSYCEEQLEHAIKKDTEFVKASDSVEHPLHYTQNDIECIEAIKASMTSDGFLDYCKGNVLKYIWRWRDKGGVQDLEKAKVYLTWMIETAKENKK